LFSLFAAFVSFKRTKGRAVYKHVFYTGRDAHEAVKRNTTSVVRI